MANYDVKTVDLSIVVNDRTPLFPQNRGVDSLLVMNVTGGGTPELYIGDGPPIPVYAGFAVELCPPELAGVSYRNPTAAAGELTVYASFGGATASSSV